jgi:hypothetical protein
VGAPTAIEFAACLSRVSARTSHALGLALVCRRVSFVPQGESANVALAFANPFKVERLLGVDIEPDNVGSTTT